MIDTIAHVADTPALMLLPAPARQQRRTCYFCEGCGVVRLTRLFAHECPTCRGSGFVVDTPLTVGGMLGRARQLGLASMED